MVGLALRCQDANATRNIPHVESTTEAFIGSMWKRALGQQIALTSVTFHGACAFLFIAFLSVHLIRLFSTLLSRLGTVRLGFIVHRTARLAIHGRQFFVEVSFSSSADPTLVGRWRPPSGF